MGSNLDFGLMNAPVSDGFVYQCAKQNLLGVGGYFPPHGASPHPVLNQCSRFGHCLTISRNLGSIRSGCLDGLLCQSTGGIVERKQGHILHAHGVKDAVQVVALML